MIAKIKNEISLAAFCVSMGVATSLIIWTFLRVMKLGILGLLFPIIMFSGEEQMADLMINYGNYLPVYLIAVAAVTGALLGAVMKKPLAVAGLLLICFPIQLSIWIFLAACMGSRFSKKGTSKM